MSPGDRANRVCPMHGQTVGMERSGEVGGTRSFLPAVEGMRACAAIGVVITHVAFQTGHTTWIDGRLLGRFDLAVAVFFALSGFLLWRGHAAAARGLRHARRRVTICAPGWSASCPATWWRSW